MRELILDLRGLRFGPERADLGPERANLRPERGLQAGMMMAIGWAVRTDVWKFTPMSYRTLALWGCCSKRRVEELSLALWVVVNIRSTAFD